MSDACRQIESRCSWARTEHSAYTPTVAILVIRSASRSEPVISERLGLAPSERSGLKQLPAEDAEATWLLSSEGHVESPDVRNHLDWLLDVLEPAREQLLALQGEADTTFQVCCPLEGAGGVFSVLWPEQMARLAALNLECSFAIALREETEADLPPNE